MEFTRLSSKSISIEAWLAATGIVKQAARAIGASLKALYKLLQRPGAEGFARAWEAAIDSGVARLEDCALQRAIEGEERPVVSAGRLVTTYTRYDTQLLMFLLRQRRHRHGPALPAREEQSPDQIYAEIDAQLDRMRENWLREKGLADEDDDTGG